MIDVTHEINAVRRTVGTRVLEAGEARVVTLVRIYPTSLDDLWAACTDPERIRRWFLPVSGELRVGGHYQLDGNAGGTVTWCDPPAGFDATWEMAGDVSWIELRLAAAGGAARFELTHIALADDDRWAEFGPGAVGVGWDSGLLGLSLYLDTPVEFDASEFGPAWMGSTEARTFMARASDAWRAANVAGGADPAAARTAAERTTAAYTGG